MGSLKQIMIKNRTYYFYNDIIDIETFDLNMLHLDKKSYKDLDIYNIGYVTIKEIGQGYDINSVIHYICVLTMQMDILKK